MSETQYSSQEIDDVWNDLNSAKTELQTFESKDSETKKQLIIRIRDDVRILVKAEKIQIKENLIKSYVLDILERNNISYPRGHLTDLFTDQEKRNYSIDPKGSIHEHFFKIVTSTPQGKWEKCDCGTNRLNGIEQMDLFSETKDSTNNLTVRETIEPQGIQFEYLKLKKEQFSQCIHAIDTIISKCTLDITSIKKQTTEHKRRKSPQHEYEKLYNATKLLTDKRANVVLEELSDIDKSQINETKKSITEIINSTKKLNDRTKITSYEKAVAKILIEKFDYFIGDIANILNITTKHVKNNILKQKITNIDDQDSMLEQLDFMARCPGCGIGIADHFESQYKIYQKGHSITEPFELNSYPFPTFAKQIIHLKQQLRKRIMHNKQKDTKIELLKTKLIKHKAQR